MTSSTSENPREMLHNLHAYEIIGEVILRRSGIQSAMVHCKIVRTRVLSVEQDKDKFLVTISDIASGYQKCSLLAWFDDWTEADNIDGRDLQSGRPVDIAMRVEDIEGILTDKQPRDIVAVRVMNRWVLASVPGNLSFNR